MNFFKTKPFNAIIHYCIPVHFSPHSDDCQLCVVAGAAGVRGRGCIFNAVLLFETAKFAVSADILDP